MTAIAPGTDAAGLRAEHDALAGRLAARRSIDLIRRAAYGGFAAFLAGSLSLKLAFDRWWSTRSTRFQGPPAYLFVALAAALALLAVTALLLRRARRHMADEDAAFARLRALRETLELDP